MVWKILWDSEKDANEFFHSYSEGLAKVYPGFAAYDQNEGSLADIVHFSKFGKVVELSVTQPIA